MRLNEQCKRNINRFPDDFRFQLTNQEVAALISQIAISKGRGGTRKLPYAFTEHSAIMASNVLKSKQAIETSINIVRTFVQMRQMVVDVEIINKKIAKLENKFDAESMHNKDQITKIFQHLRQLILEPPPLKRKIGFIVDNKRNVS